MHAKYQSSFGKDEGRRLSVPTQMDQLLAFANTLRFLIVLLEKVSPGSHRGETLGKETYFQNHRLHCCIVLFYLGPGLYDINHKVFHC